MMMVNIMLINIDPENHHFLMETSLQPLSARDGYHHMSSSAGIMTFPMYGFFKKKMFQTTNQIRWLYHVEHIGLDHVISYYTH